MVINTKNKAKKIIYFKRLFTLILVVMNFFILSCRNFTDEKAQLDKIISEIEEFKIKNGQYPKKISEATTDTFEYSLFYSVDTLKNSYYLYYSKDYDENFSYSSETKKWEKKILN